MNHLRIPASPTTPEVEFDFSAHSLAIKGESYPENASAFYQPIIDATRAYLAECGGSAITVNISLGYFNSSSTKLLFSFFEALNNSAADGNHITLNWFYDEDDETILEFGEDIQEDFKSLDFRSQIIELG
ncbi:DUF1987 domain-containing protein [Marinimicrobium alkaliphilum]|uniref:DUF1987 domain-containing protein n=1 Tax=Marinimicrobium alkaliphilum TaxID=2202654 RepID=UPI000DBAB682|nr:DUF1987 domain-containing protein [Marinimicrobium alkaliphilum]